MSERTFDPTSLIGPGDFPFPTMRTEVATFDHAHPVAVGSDKEVYFCCHEANAEGSTVLEIPRDVIGDRMPNDADDLDQSAIEEIESFVLEIANRHAAAVWN